jgi:RepB DNA-primase from phage plasmid
MAKVHPRTIDQIRRYALAFFPDLKTGVFEVRAIHQSKDTERHWPKTWTMTGAQLFQALENDNMITGKAGLALMNTRLWHIYARPLDHRFVFVDDLELGCAEALRYAPTVVVETSPGNTQLWLDAGPDCGDEFTNRAIAQHIQIETGGDPGSTGRNHLGRLPGLRNVKLMHENDGRYPFAVLKTAKNRTCAKSSALAVTPQIQQAAAAMREQHQEAARKAVEIANLEDVIEGDADGQLMARAIRYNYARSQDRSHADFAAVIYCLNKGMAAEKAAAWLARLSPKAQERTPEGAAKYALGTVSAALAKKR